MRALVIGFGAMGALRGSRLEELGIRWNWYDPAVNIPSDSRLKDLNSDSLAIFTHVIVSTNISSHMTVVRAIRNMGFEGPVLVEKPLTLSPEDFDELNADTELYVGLTERFNPAVIAIKGTLSPSDLLNISFTRTSPGRPQTSYDAFADLAIHDIDLVCWLYPGLEFGKISCWKVANSDSFALQAALQPGNKLCSFFWSNDTRFKERQVVIREFRRTIYLDLIAKTATELRSDNLNTINRQLAKTSLEDGVTRQLTEFLAGNLERNFALSHSVFLGAYRALNDKADSTSVSSACWENRSR